MDCVGQLVDLSSGRLYRDGRCERERQLFGRGEARGSPRVYSTIAGHRARSPSAIRLPTASTAPGSGPPFPNSIRSRGHSARRPRRRPESAIDGGRDVQGAVRQGGSRQGQGFAVRIIYVSAVGSAGVLHDCYVDTKWNILPLVVSIPRPPPGPSAEPTDPAPSSASGRPTSPSASEAGPAKASEAGAAAAGRDGPPGPHPRRANNVAIWNAILSHPALHAPARRH